ERPTRDLLRRELSERRVSLAGRGVLQDHDTSPVRCANQPTVRAAARDDCDEAHTPGGAKRGSLADGPKSGDGDAHLAPRQQTTMQAGGGAPPDRPAVDAWRSVTWVTYSCAKPTEHRSASRWDSRRLQ